MAAHVHTQIRKSLVTALTGLATTGNRVYANRVWPLSGAELPAIRLFSEDEEVAELGLAAQWRQRVLTIAVDACAKASSTLDDTLDQIGKEIEIALASGITVSGQTLYPTYMGMGMDFEEADQPVGIKRHRYRISFAAASATPDTL